MTCGVAACGQLKELEVLASLRQQSATWLICKRLPRAYSEKMALRFDEMKAPKSGELEWIYDRLPTMADSDEDGEVQILWPNSTHYLYVPFRDVIPGMPWRMPIRTLLVKLTYFKRSGKFYDDGSFEVLESTSLHAIWSQVREMRESGKLPGLVDGAGREFMVLVNVPGHPHEHPYIIV